MFGKDRASKSETVYCCICAGKHSETNCPNKVYSKSEQFNNVREKFAKETSFRQVGNYYDRRQNEKEMRNNDNRNRDKPRYDDWTNGKPKKTHSNIQPDRSSFENGGYKRQRRDDSHRSSYNVREDLDRHYLNRHSNSRRSPRH